MRHRWIPYLALLLGSEVRLLVEAWKLILQVRAHRIDIDGGAGLVYSEFLVLLISAMVALPVFTWEARKEDRFRRLLAVGHLVFLYWAVYACAETLSFLHLATVLLAAFGVRIWYLAPQFPLPVPTSLEQEKRQYLSLKRSVTLICMVLLIVLCAIYAVFGILTAIGCFVGIAALFGGLLWLVLRFWKQPDTMSSVGRSSFYIKKTLLLCLFLSLLVGYGYDFCRFGSAAWAEAVLALLAVLLLTAAGVLRKRWPNAMQFYLTALACLGAFRDAAGFPFLILFSSGIAFYGIRYDFFSKTGSFCIPVTE